MKHIINIFKAAVLVFGIWSSIMVIVAILCNTIFKNEYNKSINLDQDKQILIQYCNTHHIKTNSINFEKICNAVIINAQKYGIKDRFLVYAIIAKESEFNKYAVNTNINLRTGVKTLDYSYMMINTIWKDILFTNCDIYNNIMFDENYNIHAGCYILSHNLNKYNNIYKAVWAYNGITSINLTYPQSVFKIYYELNILRR
ncbi:MAG: transglycosylase SLT domain-containing protein [Erysipelotrichaceae bacterium]